MALVNSSRPGDPSSDVLSFRRQPLDSLFAPHTVAVVGANEKTRNIGRTVLRNLMDTPFGGTVYPIHPDQSQVLGIKAYRKLGEVPEPLDLVLVAAPPRNVPEIIGECAEAHVKNAIILSPGFREMGQAGTALEREILEKARGKLRLLGPNSIGIMRPVSGLNATFAPVLPRKGGIGFISQSGSLGTAVLDWSIQENFGFSTFVSVGSRLDLGWGDLIDYLASDPATESIVLYIESIGDARSFLSAARQAARDKPILVLKAGRTPAGAQAASHHTGMPTENDAVLDAALRRAGALRVDRVADLFRTAELLAKQPRPKGPRLLILTNAGGPGILSTDTLVEQGGTLAALGEETLANLNELLPPTWSHSNPVDIGGDADPARYARTLEILSREPGADGILVMLAPQVMSDPTATAEAIKPFAQLRTRPLLAAWMGGGETRVGSEILRAASVPVVPYPDEAVHLFALLWRFQQNLNGLYETPTAPLVEIDDGMRERVRDIIGRARAAGRRMLTEDESRQVLEGYRIPYIATRLATKPTEATRASDELGYPVVMKINSDRLVTKQSYGGVILNITSAANVRATFSAVKRTVTNLLGKDQFKGVLLQHMENLQGGYALHMGSMLDPQFGPILRVGAEKRPPLVDAQGQAVTADVIADWMQDARYRDDALGLPPLNTTLARRMIERTRIFQVLQDAGIPPEELEQVLVHFSQLVVEQPWIQAVEIHPLMVMPPVPEQADRAPRVLALDARIMLHDPATPEAELPRPAIRPYPWQYEEPYVLRDNTPVLIRPIRPDDEPLLVHFHEKLSEQSVYLRYFAALNLSQRVAHERLSRMAFIDYERELALVIETQPQPGADGRTPPREILGVARLSQVRATGDSEFAVLIRDDCQQQGLGTLLLTKIVEIARAEGMKRVFGEILPENMGMKRVAEKVGFKLRYEIDAGITLAELIL